MARRTALLAVLILLCVGSLLQCDRSGSSAGDRPLVRSDPSLPDEAASLPLAVPTADALIPLDDWRDPPLDMRPLARWWWPGGSVDAEPMRDQLGRIKRAGFGAVEVQPLLLGLGASDLSVDPRLRTAGLPSFGRSLASAATAAADLGLGFDLTLGSGWPGGLPTAKQNAERQLVMGSVDIDGPIRFVGPLPPAPDQSYRRAVEWVLDVLGPQDHDTQLVAVLAVRLGPERGGLPTIEETRVVTPAAESDRLDWAVPIGSWRILAFYENATEHFVMGGAFPGEESDARVVDHLSERGANALLEGYAGPILGALWPDQVRELFVDSFELMGELPFTGGFLDAFEKRAGYDLTPHLPLLYRRGGESKYAEMMDLFGRNGGPLYTDPEPERADRIREDYESVRATLFEERFIDRIRGWAHQRGMKLRLQAHGGYGDYLDVYARADVPEAEALFGGGSFDFLKLAASAAHVAGRRWASSESFITLRLLGTRLTEDEMRLLAGRAYSAGINRLAIHGVPYPYTRADGEAWYPFSGGFGRILAGPLPMSSQIDDELLARLPDLNRLLGRLTLAMSRGHAAADVAWLRANPIFPDRASFQLGRVTPHEGESPTTQALRARGLTHDRVSRRMLASAHASEGACRVGAARYRAILLDPIEVAEPELVESLVALAEAGVPVLSLGELPNRAPGLRDAEGRDRKVRAATRKLETLSVAVPHPDQLEAILERELTAGVVEPVPGERLHVSIDRRESDAGDTLLLFNESWSPHTTRLRFTRDGGVLTLWDPRTGFRRTLRDRVTSGDVVPIELGAAESLILTLEPMAMSRPGEL